MPRISGFGGTLALAEQNLARRDIKTALEYVVWDNLDPLPWEDIERMAAGRTVRSSHQARQTAEKSPVERLGGLLAVAAHMLDANDKGRGQKIVEDVERELSSTNRQH